MPINKTNIDAMYWAHKFCEVDKTADEELLFGYFANYRFAISDPLNAKLAVKNKRIKELEIYIDNLPPPWRRIRK